LGEGTPAREGDNIFELKHENVDKENRAGRQMKRLPPQGGCGSERWKRALEGDFARVVEGWTTGGVEEPGEITRHRNDGDDDVDGRKESFIEELEVAHDLITRENGIAESVLLLTEAVPRGLLGGGDDRGGETGELDILERSMGLGGEHTLALRQDCPTGLHGMWLEVPGIGGGIGVGRLGGWDRFVFARRQERQVLGGEDVAGGRGGGGANIGFGAHRTLVPLRARARLSRHSTGPVLFGRGWIRSRSP